MALILVMGFAVTLGIATRSIVGRLSQVVDNSSNYADKTRAKNIASSAAEIYVRKLTVGTAAAGDSANNTMMGGSYTVVIKSIDKSAAAKPDSLKMVTIGRYDSTYAVDGRHVPVTDTIVNIVTGNLSVSPPLLDGAMSVSAGSKVNLALGSSDTVDGHNFALNGTIDSTSCASVHGLAYAQSGDIAGSTLNTNVKGVDAFVPDTVKVDTIPNYQPLIDQLVPLADTTLTSNTSTAALTLGTASKPRITLIDAGITLHGPTTGVGILIVRPGNGTFQTSTTFSFTGLILVVGTGTKAQIKFGSTATIIGGMVMSGTQVKVDFNAGSSSQVIKYSCQALALAFSEPKLLGNYIIASWWE